MSIQRKYKNLSVEEMSKRMSVLVTNICTMNCGNCSQKGFRMSQPYQMSIDEVELLINSCKKMNHVFDDLTVTGGEPTLWKFFHDGVKMIKESGITKKVTVLTNGYINAPKKIENTKHFIDEVFVSYYGINKDGYDLLMNMDGVVCNEAIDWHMPRQSKPILDTIPAICRARFMTYVGGKVYHCPNCYPNHLELGTINEHPECFCCITNNWIQYFKEQQESHPRYDNDVCGMCLLNLNLLDYSNSKYKKIEFRK